MQTSVTFKNLDPSETIKSYVCDKLNRFDKFLYSSAEANVVLSVEKFRHIAEVNINGDRMTFVGKEETDDMYSAIDIVLDKIEKQIKRGKQKFRDRRAGNHFKSKAAFSEHTIAAEDEAAPQIHIKNIEYKPMDVEEAIMQMDLIKDAFLVFTNAKSERVNVLYRRKDGNFGLIQPSS
ncbi:MAG: ribosome-associated translation inhibitor RaiA [Desulfobacteraceae bacterium]|jgi:putative sigma-54 modulation protein